MTDHVIPVQLEPNLNPDGVVIRIYRDGIAVSEQHLPADADHQLLDLMATSAAEITGPHEGHQVTIAGWDGDTGQLMMRADFEGDE